MPLRQRDVAQPASIEAHGMVFHDRPHQRTHLVLLAWRGDGLHYPPAQYSCSEDKRSVSRVPKRDKLDIMRTGQCVVPFRASNTSRFF